MQRCVSSTERCMHSNLESLRPMVLPKNKEREFKRRKSRAAKNSRDFLLKE